MVVGRVAAALLLVLLTCTQSGPATTPPDPTPTAEPFIQARAGEDYRDPTGRFVLSLPLEPAAEATGEGGRTHIAYADPFKCQIDIVAAGGTDYFRPSAAGDLLTLNGPVSPSRASDTEITTGFGIVNGWRYRLPGLYGRPPYRAEGFGGRIAGANGDWAFEAACVNGSESGLARALEILRSWRPRS